jgi:hypothetical protein
MIKANRKQLDVMLMEIQGYIVVYDEVGIKAAFEEHWDHPRHHIQAMLWYNPETDHSIAYFDQWDEPTQEFTTHENGIVQLLDMLEEWRRGCPTRDYSISSPDEDYLDFSVNFYDDSYECIYAEHPDLRIAIALCLLRADGREVEFEEK